MNIIAEELKSIPPNTGYSGSGVYLVCSMNTKTGEEYLHYIGSSRNVYKRWKSSNHPFRIVFDNTEWPYIAYLRVIQTDNPLPIEKEMISKYQPKMNKQWR